MATQARLCLALLALCAALAAAAPAASHNPIADPNARVRTVVLKQGRAARAMSKWVRQRITYPASVRDAEGRRWAPHPHNTSNLAWPLGLRRDYRFLPPTADEKAAAEAFLKSLNTSCDNLPANFSLSDVRRAATAPPILLLLPLQPPQLGPRALLPPAPLLTGGDCTRTVPVADAQPVQASDLGVVRHRGGARGGLHALQERAGRPF